MFWKNENVKLKKGDAFHFYGDSALFFSGKSGKTTAVRFGLNSCENGGSLLRFCQDFQKTE